MIDRTTRQLGFSIVEGVIALVVVCVIAAGGALVYSNYHKSPKANPASDMVSSSQTKEAIPVTQKSASSVPASQQTEVTTTTTVSIPALNIEITVPNAIADLTYTTSSGTLTDGAEGTMARISTSTLTSDDSECSASNGGPLGVLESVSGQYPTNVQQTETDSYGQLVKQFSTFYVSYFSGSQAACSANPSVPVASYAADFQSSLSSIQQTN